MNAPTLFAKQCEEVKFFCEGLPAPGGSKTAFVARRKDGSLVCRKGTNYPVINMTDAGGDANKRWRKVVAWVARQHFIGRKPHEGPVKSEFIFFMRRPKAHYRTGSLSHLLRDDAPEFHTYAPDSLKLSRSTEDSLKNIIWVDDSQAIRTCSEKRWASASEKPGCLIRIMLL